MKKIFLCCAAGMSTSMVVNKMKQAATQKGIEAEIIAVAMEEFDSTLPKYDCCLLGPQIKYKFEEFKKKAEAVGKSLVIAFLEREGLNVLDLVPMELESGGLVMSFVCADAEKKEAAWRALCLLARERRV